MYKVLIRADASTQIGAGHIMRDLVLAKQFRDAQVSFATRNLDGNLDEHIKKSGFDVITLKSSAIDELVTVIQENGFDELVIDHYDIGYQEERYIKEKTGIKIFVIDDTYQQHECDILLNHNVCADQTRYYDLVPKYCEIRCGKEFTLLREEFYQVKKEPKEKNSDGLFHIFIGMGGTDPKNITTKLLDLLEDIPNLQIDVVTTHLNRNIHQLQQYALRLKNCHVHINCDYIAKLIYHADLAIVTPSVIVNEVLFLETPFLAIKTVDNQNEMYHYLKKNGYLIFDEFDKTELKNTIQSIVKESNVLNISSR